MLIRAVDRKEVSDPRDAVTMRSLITAAEHGPDLSVTSIRLQGRHRRLRTERSTRVYYVIDGCAAFSVGDSQPFVAQRGDAVIVAPGTPYEFEGNMTYLVINTPAFQDGDDLYCEE